MHILKSIRENSSLLLIVLYDECDSYSLLSNAYGNFATSEGGRTLDVNALLLGVGFFFPFRTGTQRQRRSRRKGKTSNSNLGFGKKGQSIQ